MLTTISADVSIDLTSLGVQRPRVPGKLVCDGLGVPAEVEFDAPGASTAALNAILRGGGLDALLGQSLAIATHDGRRVQTVLAAIGHVAFDDGNTVLIRAHVGPSRTVHAHAGGATTPAAWHLSLTNVRLRRGDDWVEHPPSSGGGVSLSRLRFTVGGRERSLIDEHLRTRRKAGAPPANAPVESAALTSPFLPGDAESMVATIAADLEQLLRFGLGRDVRFVSLSTLDAAGGVLASTSRAVHVEPEGVGAGGPVNNWQTGVLRQFLERAQPVVAAEPEWWQRTLGLHWQAQAAKHIEIKTAILNILVDRITTRLLGAADGAEIDAALPGRLDDAPFRGRCTSCWPRLARTGRPSVPRQSSRRSRSSTRALRSRTRSAAPACSWVSASLPGGHSASDTSCCTSARVGRTGRRRRPLLVEPRGTHLHAAAEDDPVRRPRVARRIRP